MAPDQCQKNIGEVNVNRHPAISRVKHDVNKRWQTAKITANFEFFSSNPLIHHTEIIVE